MKPSPFYFSNPAQFLQAVLDQKQAQNPRFSLRQFSKQLGFSNPATLSRVLQGKRKFGFKLVKRISEKISLSDSEIEHLAFLAFLDGILKKDSATRGSPLDIAYKKRTTFSADQFQFIKEWYSIAILLMSSLRDFKPDPQWISDRLIGHITPEQCQDTIERLIRLDLLKRLPDGTLCRSSFDSVDVSFQESTEAVREYYKQILCIALAKLEREPEEKRRIDVTTTAFAKSDLKTAKEIIFDTHSKLGNLSRDATADQVYVFSTQLLQVTE